MTLTCLKRRSLTALKKVRGSYSEIIINFINKDETNSPAIWPSRARRTSFHFWLPSVRGWRPALPRPDYLPSLPIKVMGRETKGRARIAQWGPERRRAVICRVDSRHYTNAWHARRWKHLSQISSAKSALTGESTPCSVEERSWAKMASKPSSIKRFWACSDCEPWFRLWACPHDRLPKHNVRFWISQLKHHIRS